MTVEELNKLGHSIAYESCAAALDGMGVGDGLGMVIDERDLAHYEVEGYRLAMDYLEARGLIQRDAEKPGWLAVLEESEAAR